MSPTPDVVITRQLTGNVTAAGGDRLAATLLEQAGFVIETAPHSFWYRLSWDMGERRENEMASHAAQTLSAVGYRVDLDPDLDVLHVTTPTDPLGHYVHGHQLLALTDQLNGTESYEAAADLTDHVLEPTDGVLARLGEFFEAAGEQAKASETEEGLELADRFEGAAATVRALGEDLHVAAEEMRALRAPAAPSWQAQLPNYYATAPARRTAPATTSPREPAPTPPAQPTPRRAR